MENPEDNKTKIMNSGAIELISNILKIHIDDLDICSEGCDTFKILTINGKMLYDKTRHST